MSFTYDPTTDIGKVRLFCSDTESDKYVFEDEEITAMLSVNSDVRLASAAFIDIIASSEARIQKKFSVLNFSIDGPAVANALRAHAKSLREVVDNEGGFDFAEQCVNDFSVRDRIYKQFLRGAEI